ncbi:MAG: DUF134 domain-containing protein [Candidatus Omnitrophica bacterium]|nr:DUF134 domain-containing protein [Candidatus Omnitrophota bacterium]
MPRPFRCRRVRCRPDANYFKPRGIPADLLDEIDLTMDELEAIRLADLEGNYQEDAAKKMNVSRQTFGNIVISAHKKIADALVNSKALKIEGGVVKMMEKHFTCYDCENEWSLAYGSGRPNECPKCRSLNIHRAPQGRGRAGAGGFGGGRGRCWRGQR